MARSFKRKAITTEAVIVDMGKKLHGRGAIFHNKSTVDQRQKLVAPTEPGLYVSKQMRTTAPRFESGKGE